MQFYQPLIFRTLTCHYCSYPHIRNNVSSFSGIKGHKPVQKANKPEQQYYDYIDTSKAEEKGIRLKKNYAYLNPFGSRDRNAAKRNRGDKKPGKNPEYVEPNTATKKQPEVIEVKENLAYSQQDSKKKDVNSRVTEQKTYASPLTKIEEEESATPAEDGAKESASGSSNLLKTGKVTKEGNKMYAPPLTGITASMSSAKDSTLTRTIAASMEDSKLLTTVPDDGEKTPLPKKKEMKMYASPLNMLDKDPKSEKSDKKKSGKKPQLPKKPEETYYSLGSKKTSTDDKTKDEGIELKSNYAYKVAKKISTKTAVEASYAIPEGDKESEDSSAKKTKNKDIEMKANTAYKATSGGETGDAPSESKPKKRPKKVKKPTTGNADLSKAYS